MKEPDNTISILGAGNVATHIALALKRAGYVIRSVYSRTQDSAAALARQLEAVPTCNLENVLPAAIFIYSVKDDILPELALANSSRYPDALHIHTSGSTPIDVFGASCYGVLYPMQTFSRQADLCFEKIPCFVEGNHAGSLAAVKHLAGKISDRVVELDSERRRYLHLSAVFACNFANHCYAIAARILEDGAGLPFEILFPLIDETASKVHRLSPQAAQTGPAVRYDHSIMDRHLELLKNDRLRREVYEMMSRSIHEYAQKPDRKIQTTNTIPND